MFISRSLQTQQHLTIGISKATGGGDANFDVILSKILFNLRVIRMVSHFG